MGLITEILGVTRTDEDGAPVEDIQIDGGGGANVTARHVAPPGDDSPPLAGDKAFVVEGPQTGSEVAVGYLDGTAKQAAPGEKRIYARDSSGNPVMVVWLRQSGGANDGPSIELGIDPSDFVALASRVLEELESIKSDLESLSTAVSSHTHPVSVDTTTGVGATTGIVYSAPTFHTPESVGSETVKVQP